MRTKLLRVLGISVAIVVTLVAIPGSAYAVGNGSRTLLLNYSNRYRMGVAGGNSRVQDGTAIITWTCNQQGPCWPIDDVRLRVGHVGGLSGAQCAPNRPPPPVCGPFRSVLDAHEYPTSLRLLATVQRLCICDDALRRWANRCIQIAGECR